MTSNPKCDLKAGIASAVAELVDSIYEAHPGQRVTASLAMEAVLRRHLVPGDSPPCAQMTAHPTGPRRPCGESEDHWRHTARCNEACYTTMECGHHPFSPATPERVYLDDDPATVVPTTDGMAGSVWLFGAVRIVTSADVRELFVLCNKINEAATDWSRAAANRNRETEDTCPPRCNAGGSDADDGHVWDVQLEFLRCLECGAEWVERDVPEALMGGWAPERRWASVIAHSVGGCSPRAARCSGGSVACRCGLTAMDRDLMRLP